MDIEMKWLPVQVKAVNAEARTVEGYASTSQVDYSGDVILPSAWEKSLRTWKKASSRPKFLAYHKHSLDSGHSPVIGLLERAETTDEGLSFKASFAETELGNEHLYLYDHKMMDAFSVGFITQASEMNPEVITDLLKENGIKATKGSVTRVITEAHLLEISAVVVGMNIGALVKSVEPLAAKYAEALRSEGIVIDPDGKVVAQVEVGMPPTATDSPALAVVAVTENGKEAVVLDEKPAGGGWDETDDYCRLRLREPGEFQEGSFRTITLKKDKPRIMSIMGRLKGEKTLTKQNVMFPKEDGWTLAKAKVYVKENPEIRKWVDGIEPEERDIGAEIVETMKALADAFTKHLEEARGITKLVEEIKAAIDDMAEEKADAGGPGARDCVDPKAMAKADDENLDYMRGIFEAAKKVKEVLKR